ncbi:Serine/threonine-protein kinase ssp1 like [Verticillium longisporum]|nr:Serine/threonine-protein kinase ssp1 like [Verticillium longisporum]
MSSPGLFSPSNPRPRHNYPGRAASDSNTPVQEVSSPYLHPLQHHKVRETHKALIDSDSITGRKLINQYEVIEEIGRGMHGKVKLARNIETNDNVAIKIIPRYSKRRRLGKVAAMSPQDKTMREIAILKKMRHPNVVSLLEIIDDPELKKIYLILEHVELGEVVWRKKGLPHICMHERRRIEREMRGEAPTPEEEQYDLFLERRQAIKDLKRAKMSQANAGPHDYWSIEHGIADDGSNASQSRVPSNDDLALFDRLPGDVTQSVKSMNQPPPDLSASPDGSDMETPGPLRSSNQGSSAALDGTMYGAYIEERAFRGRSPSMADSIISHMSSIDWNPRTHDPFADDFSYVPCFTLEQARSVFRDTVLGLEYLHYQGVVHRDIKPANLLWTKDHRVKISDFGVSYFGRPIRDGEPDDEAVSESEAQDFDDDLELAKTPRISEQIDIWSLGVTLYCLIFARIPFQAEDEWAMFKKIATEDVFIPRQRLRPVDPSTSPDENSLYKRQNKKPYRDDNDLVYEEIDNLLYDLLRLMFTKSPDKRVRLRDIKRHPWVVQGISNPIAWIDETDPARPSQGRRVQVDAKETAHAVVPITFLERARSVVKKAVGKVMHPLVSERGDSRSRRRATSSVASSAGESNVPHAAVPITNPRDLRRKSLKSDDYFAGIYSATPDHPLSQSVEASPSDSAYDPLATAIAQPSQSASSSQKGRSVRDASNEEWPASYDSKKSSASVYRPANRQPQTTTGNNFLALTAASTGSQTVPSSPAAAMSGSAMQWHPAPSTGHRVDPDLYAQSIWARP